MLKLICSYGDFTIDYEGRYSGHAGTLMLVADQQQLDPFYLLGVLNSRVFWFFVRHTMPRWVKASTFCGVPHSDASRSSSPGQVKTPGGRSQPQSEGFLESAKHRRHVYNCWRTSSDSLRRCMGLICPNQRLKFQKVEGLVMPDDHDAILQDWKANAAKNEHTNFRFQRSLKMVSNPKRIDILAAELHAEAFGLIDCTRCANCCKTIPPGVTDDDIGAIAVQRAIHRDLPDGRSGRGWIPDESDAVSISRGARPLHDLRRAARGLQAVSAHRQEALYVAGVPTREQHPGMPRRLLHRGRDASPVATAVGRRGSDGNLLA
jgi:hypothetical protein